MRPSYYHSKEAAAFHVNLYVGMAKVKLAGPKKTKPGKAADIRGALPCLVIVVGGFAVIMLIFYLSLQTANQ